MLNFDINNLENLPDLSSGEFIEAESIEDLLKKDLTEEAVNYLVQNLNDEKLKQMSESLDKSGFGGLEFNLSQSKIKSFWSFLNGDICGKQFLGSLTDNNISTVKESAAMIKGQCFEYTCTGQKNYTGDVPDFSVLENRNGTLNKAGEVNAIQAKNWKYFLINHNCSELESGKFISYKNEKYSVSALSDVLCKMNKDGQNILVNIDLKFGAPDNEFGKFAWHDEKLSKSDYLLLQAIHTKFILYKTTGINVPFIFYIADSSNSNNAKAREIEIEDFETRMKEHEELIIKTYNSIRIFDKFGLFEARAEIKWCSWCNVEGCESKSLIASLRTIKI